MKKLRIGIDIDDTIADTNELLDVYAFKYDKEFKEGKGIVNPNEYKYNGMFDWTKEDRNDFLSKYQELVMKSIVPKIDASHFINKLKNDGHEIYIISYRKSKYLSDPYKLSADWLKENSFPFDKLIVDSGDKGIVAHENNIDLMIDDKADHCRDAKSYGIDVLLFDSNYNKDDTELRRAKSWKEVYEIIEEKINQEV